MFPYPSGDGLHIGHPLGYTGTDVYTRYQRMAGRNVLYTMGFDAFGLPAEQYAVETGQHPADHHGRRTSSITARQLRRLGISYDRRRSIETTDPGTTAGRSGSSPASSTRGTTPTPPLPTAAPAEPGRSAS